MMFHFSLWWSERRRGRGGGERDKGKRGGGWGTEGEKREERTWVRKMGGGLMKTGRKEM